jgi:AbrB family looped-hinge helix DNA binding protein
LEKTLGSSRVQPNFRVTLTKDVRNKLRVKVGSIVMFVEDDKGELILKKAELKPV